MSKILLVWLSPFFNTGEKAYDFKELLRKYLIFLMVS